MMTGTKRDVGYKKRKLVNELLDNNVYEMESGLIVQLSKGLMKLSLIELGQLEIVMGCKLNNEWSKGRQELEKE